MAVSKHILGMNARNFLYIRKYNRPSAKRTADDKLATKQILLANHISTAPLFAKFEDRRAIYSFNWYSLPKDGFVIKPARGYGGAGIIAFKSWNGESGETISGTPYTVQELNSHILNILDGAFSLQYLPDKAFIEERVTPHPFFRKLAPLGLPDIRVIVFNHVPVMAMMRLPTEQSQGKANLHLGAVALGIDLRTGITTYAVSKNDLITRLPDSKMKVRGIKLPEWNKLLLLASHTQSALHGLGYAGVDIVVDAKKGPLVLEVNARPGLAIQIANSASLRERLERVEGMKIPTPERGVEVAQSLFAESATEKVDTAPKILEVIEPVTIGFEGQVKTVLAKLDTGAYRTSLDEALAEEMDLPINDETLLIKAASGQQVRKTVPLSFVLSGKKVNTVATVTDRSHLKYPIIVGRRDLKGFLINPVITKHQEKGDALDDKEENA